MENKNTELLSQIYDLRRLIKRVAYEEDLNLISLEKKCERKDDKIRQLEDNIRFLEKNSKWLDSVASFWRDVLYDEAGDDFT